MDLVSLPHFINSTRDSGYRGTAAALAELVDNAIEAKATKICISVSKNELDTVEVDVTDDGVGMSSKDLMVALQFGGSKRFNNRTGLGRYGMGLPNSSVSQCRRLEVITWTDKSKVFKNYLDVDEISDNKFIAIKSSVRLKSYVAETNSGTHIKWRKCDRLSFKNIKTLVRNLHYEFGRIFRKLIDRGIRILVNGVDIKPIDPLFINAGLNLLGGMPYGDKLEYTVQIPSSNQYSKIIIQFIELPVEKWHTLSNDEKRLYNITKRAGVSIIRAGREIDYGWYFMGDKRKENYDDWWRCQIEFTPDLDEAFGVTHTKQEIQPTEYLKQLITPDLEQIAKKLNSRVRDQFIHIKASQPAFGIKKQLEQNDHFLEPPTGNPSLQTLTSTGIQKVRGNGKIKGFSYSLAYDDFNSSEFFKLAFSEDELKIIFNKKHVFYHEVYSKLEGGGTMTGKDFREVIDTLIFSFARGCSLIGHQRSTKKACRSLGASISCFSIMNNDKVLDLTPVDLKIQKDFLVFCRSVNKQLKRSVSNLETLREVKFDLIRQYSPKFTESTIALYFAKSLFIDLLLQGWEIKSIGRRAILTYKVNGSTDPLQEKEKIRNQHLIARDAQLATSSVIDFVRNIEKRKLTPTGWHSIFSVMCDGRYLYDQIQRAKEQHSSKLETIIKPYIQFVEPEVKCGLTGLYLTDIWRYFRLTWTNEYKSMPGRSFSILIRDEGQPNHPVIGIAALGSSVAQQAVRDNWIGWSGNEFFEEIRKSPTAKYAKWILNTISNSIDDIYIADFIKEKVLTRKDLRSPNLKIIDTLKKISLNSIASHRINPHPAKLNFDSLDDREWKRRAEMDLFRSKRATVLSELLGIRLVMLKNGLITGTSKELQACLNKKDFKDAIVKLVRKAKSAKVGIEMMDIIVCGAIAPYNHLLGGKLVCMLLASPEVYLYYKDRYKNKASLIASSIKGKKICKTPSLVLLNTTSLYGTGSSQYNRIKIPAEVVGGDAGEFIEYKNLGMSEGFGSFHFSNETLTWGTNWAERRGQKRVNSIFGEGANPLMRKVRELFELLGYDSEKLLHHGNKRVLYSIPLASNFRQVLLGLEKRPRYIINPKDPISKTNLIAKYWSKRWFMNRTNNVEVLEKLKQHTLSYPIRHGAKVNLPGVEELNLFTDI